MGLDFTISRRLGGKAVRQSLHVEHRKTLRGCVGKRTILIAALAKTQFCISMQLPNSLHDGQTGRTPDRRTDGRDGPDGTGDGRDGRPDSGLRTGRTDGTADGTAGQDGRWHYPRSLLVVVGWWLADVFGTLGERPCANESHVDPKQRFLQRRQSGYLGLGTLAAMGNPEILSNARVRGYAVTIPGGVSAKEVSESRVGVQVVGSAKLHESTSTKY